MKDRLKFRLYDDIHREMIDLQEQDVNPYNISDVPQNNLMQCTGLRDKNGKLIYEGDIVKDKINQTYEIIWKDNAIMFLMKHIGDTYREGLYSLIILENGIEVIGNIYENPELLEVHHV